MPESISVAVATSADGTRIAFDRYGDGPPIVLIAGAFNTRSTTEPLARAMKDCFTVFNVDRRGRGDSGDTPPYAVDREIDDLEAVIRAAGGSAAVFGFSSGATLALEAAAQDIGVTALALYDAPFKVDDSHPGLPSDFVDQLAGLVRAGRRGEAVELYQRECIRIPEELVVQMRTAPFRPALEAIAHTLVYEAMLIGDLSLPTDMLAGIRVPTLVMYGDHSPPIIQGAAEALARALPVGTLHTLHGQGHDLAPDVIAPLVRDFLSR